MTESKRMRIEIDSARLPKSWANVDAPLARDLERELEKELPPGHVLHGAKCEAVLGRTDDDDVLFVVEGGRALLAVVHLTWSGKTDSSAQFPWTTLYRTVEEWLDGAK